MKEIKKVLTMSVIGLIVIFASVFIKKSKRKIQIGRVESVGKSIDDGLKKTKQAIEHTSNQIQSLYSYIKSLKLR